MAHTRAMEQPQRMAGPESGRREDCDRIERVSDPPRPGARKFSPKRQPRIGQSEGKILRARPEALRRAWRRWNHAHPVGLGVPPKRIFLATESTEFTER